MPKVETSCGTLRGARENGLEVFRGIPYARAPVGKLRFAAPEPPARWDGEFAATSFGDAPLQTSDKLGERLGLFPAQPLSEDCLSLNVWSPGVGEGERPVLFWIHGGAFVQGAGSIPLYAGDRLAQRDVVVVTFNYRVGALGFLHVGGLDSEGEGSGCNFGLLDQIAALRWVKAEIAQFGGDPNNVTVFGESAGAGSIVSLLAMPAASGLFRRAIIQSSAPEGMIDADEAGRRTQIFLSKLGLEKGSLRELRELPVAEIMRAQTECAAGGPYTKGMLFMPVVDGESLPAMPIEGVAQGSARDVDVMIGTTRDEMRLFQLTSPPGAITEPLLEVIVAAQLPQHVSDASAAAKSVIGAYRQLHQDRGEASEAGDLFASIQTDLSMRYPATELAAHQARFNSRTYMYVFAYRSPLEAGSLGSCHALDIPFVLGTLDAPGMAEFAGTGEAAQRLASEMMDCWVAFARSGDPSHPSVGPWPAYESGSRRSMWMGDDWQVVEAPLEQQRAIFAGLAQRSDR